MLWYATYAFWQVRWSGLGTQLNPKPVHTNAYVYVHGYCASNWPHIHLINHHEDATKIVIGSSCILHWWPFGYDLCWPRVASGSHRTYICTIHNTPTNLGKTDMWSLFMPSAHGRSRGVLPCDSDRYQKKHGMINQPQPPKVQLERSPPGRNPDRRSEAWVWESESREMPIKPCWRYFSRSISTSPRVFRLTIKLAPAQGPKESTSRKILSTEGTLLSLFLRSFCST